MESLVLEASKSLFGIIIEINKENNALKVTVKP